MKRFAVGALIAWGIIAALASFAIIGCEHVTGNQCPWRKVVEP